ncbi:MAG: DnaD domain protein [Eubacteriales bacterium]|nr:DnaD domain protein [Eubacteriales bacterium]
MMHYVMGKAMGKVMKKKQFISFVDKYFSSANQTYCLVYLYGLRFHMEGKMIPDNEAIAEALRIMDSDVEKAWNYWRKKGLAKSEKGIIRLVEMESDDKEVKKIPTMKEAAQKMIQDPVFAWFCKETESRFGGELSSSEISTLQWIYDTTGLSNDVLILLADYTTMQKKTMRYMEKVALDWSKSGIDTVEKANLRLESIGKKDVKKKSKKDKFHNFEQRTTDYSDIEDEYFEEILKGMKSDG